MNVAKIDPFSISDGTGVRVSVYVSGCRRGCPGCHNQEAQDFAFGDPFTDEMIENILEYADKPFIEGMSVLGGEPLERENVAGVLKLCQRFRKRFGDAKTIWLYTGYSFEQLLVMSDIRMELLLPMLDIVVDGPYVETLRNPALAYRGSSNQRVLDMHKSLEARRPVFADVALEE